MKIVTYLQNSRYRDFIALVSGCFDPLISVTRAYDVSLYIHQPGVFNSTNLTLYGHIKTAEQRTNIQQYGDWYTCR